MLLRLHILVVNHMKIIGLIVNPIAGMGGAVGLKGTDGEIYEKALELGAQPVAPSRTDEFLSHITKRDKIKFLVASDKMGEDYVNDTEFSYRTIGNIEEETSAEDTKRIADEMIHENVELLVFVGGDGTARDIYDAVGTKVPVVGVPSGVKIFSSVFSVSARAAAKVTDAFVKGTKFAEKEVLDIDEGSFREGVLSSQLYGYLKVPETEKFLQEGKEASSKKASTQENKEKIAKYVVENMEHDTLYLLGPGTTLKAITDELGVSKTLLGIDGVFNGNIIGTDLNEEDILDLMEKYEKREIIITPIGGNGFIFGRGNKQFTPEVIKRVGRENITIVSDREKVNNLENLRVDTGDIKLDKVLQGRVKVIVGFKEEMVMEVRC